MAHPLSLLHLKREVLTAIAIPVSADVYAACLHTVLCCRDDELAETSDPVTLVYDSATRMFWRNVNARSGNAPVNKLGRKPARYDIPADVSVPPAVELLGEVMLRPQLHVDTNQLDQSL